MPIEDFENDNDIDESILDGYAEEEGIEDASAPDMPDDISDAYEAALGDDEESGKDLDQILRDIQEYKEVPEEHREREIADKETGIVYKSNEEVFERMVSDDCGGDERRRLGGCVYKENLGLVHYLVNRCNYYGSGYSDSELELVGRAKLVEAIEAFDRTEYPEIHFSTFAWHKIDGGIRTLLEKNPTIFKRLGRSARILKSLKDDYCKRIGRDPNTISLESLKEYARQLVGEEYFKARLDQEATKKEAETGNPLTEDERGKLAVQIAEALRKLKKNRPDEYNSALDEYAKSRRKELLGRKIEKYPHIDVFCKSVEDLERAETSLNRSSSVSSVDESVGDEDDEDTVITDLIGNDDLSPEEAEKEKENKEKISNAIDEAKFSRRQETLLKDFLNQEDPSQFLKGLSSSQETILGSAFTSNRLREALAESGLNV